MKNAHEREGLYMGASEDWSNLDGLLKQSLRQKMKTVLGVLSSDYRKSAGKIISHHVSVWLREVLPSCSPKVALFSSLDDEISTEDLDNVLISLGASRAIAVANSSGELCFLPVKNEDSAQSISWNDLLRADHACETNTTINPSTLDIIFLPGLAFDRRGRRLGRGQAYFDRGLSKLGSGQGQKPILVGLAMDEQMVCEIPHARHDIAINYLCTPNLGLLRVA